MTWLKSNLGKFYSDERFISANSDVFWDQWNQKWFPDFFSNATPYLGCEGSYQRDKSKRIDDSERKGKIMKTFHIILLCNSFPPININPSDLTDVNNSHVLSISRSFNQGKLHASLLSSLH